MNKKRLSIVAILGCSVIGLSAHAAEATTSSSTSNYKQELISNGNFAKKTEGWWAAGAKLKSADQMGCITFTRKGKNPWDVILGQSGLALKKGENYHLQFSAQAKQPTYVKALIQHDGAPYTNHFLEDIALNQEFKTFKFSFKPTSNDSKVQFQFQMGTEAPTTVCVKDVSLTR